MYCPRLDHFVRINANGTVSRCGHMTMAPQFKNITDLDSSQWLANIRESVKKNHWPIECVRCKQIEDLGQSSVRQQSLDRHKQLLSERSDYLVLGGVLDNVCNSACQSCGPMHSTKIGSLISKNYVKINNTGLIEQLPRDRIVQMDINGGEPSASPNYLRLLENLPANVKHLRINTNGSRLISVIPKLIKQGVKVTVTVSLDGIGHVHDYVRWPIKWKNVEKNIQAYQNMGLHDFNTWTTVSALNIAGLKKILDYVQIHKIDHSWALLEQPEVLNVKFSNLFTRAADVPDDLKLIVASGKDNTVDLDRFVAEQDRLRGIKIQDYIK